jgi:hypothetical protein
MDKPRADVGTINGILSNTLRIPPKRERIIKNTVGIAIQVATNVAIPAEANEIRVASINAEK